MIHQLRIYEIFEPTRAAFHDRFRDHAARLMREHGFDIRAMWECRTADRLEFSLDTGATTQRLQQSIIKRLEDLIEASQQQQQQQQQSQQQSQSQQQQQPNQPQQQSQSQSDNPQGENRDERLPLGGPQDAELRDTLDAARAAWGALPERVREALQQGSEDFYSRVYNSLTESYYKRLAEEGTER